MAEERGWVIRSNASEIRTHKYETILEWWLEGWQDSHHDISILTDEAAEIDSTRL